MLAEGGAVAARVRGVAAWNLLGAFAIDPVRCMDRHAARLKRAAISIEPPHPWRRDRRNQVLMLIGPEYNRQVLMATDQLRPTGIWPVRGPRGSAQETLRSNFLVMHGTEHTRVSNALLPHLERRRIATHFDAVKRIAQEQTARWPVGEVTDLFPLLRDLAQHYAFALLFGETNPARIRLFGAMIAGYHAANWSRAAALLRFDVPHTPYRNVLCSADALLAFVTEWLAERRGCPADSDVRAALLQAASDGSDAPGCPHLKRAAEVDAAAHLVSFAMASYETTTATLAWALLLLACHPQIAAALAREVSALGPLDAINDPDDLANLPLLDGVIKETMRLFAPVPVIGFKTLGQTTLAGFDLAAGATVMISPHLTHRLPGLYAEPDRFLPERWFSLHPTTYEYLPFSGGPRRCPGYQFALTNLRMALCAIITRYRLALPAGARIDRGYAAITLPSRGLPLRILPQDGRVEKPETSCRGSAFDLFRHDEGADSPAGHVPTGIIAPAAENPAPAPL